MSRPSTDLGASSLLDQNNLASDPLQDKDLSLPQFSSQQACQGTQNDDVVTQKNNVMETKGTKTERRYNVKENQNSENIQNENTNVPIGRRTVQKEKNMLLDHIPNVRKRLDIKKNGILTERNPNISTDASSNSDSLEDSRPKQVIHLKDLNQYTKNQSHTLLVPKKEVLKAPMNLKKLQQYTVKQLVHISRSKINFGTSLPGQIREESLDIVNKTNQNLVVQIALDSENQEFENTEEYVYSIRRSHLYDFNDKHYLIMAPFSSASFKVTLKVPDVKKGCDNTGYADISIQGLKQSFKVVLESKIEVPRVVCPKALYHQSSKLNIINLAGKQGKKQDYKLPFKNEGNIPLTIEFSFHNPGELYKDDKSEFSIYPQAVTLQPNNSVLLNFSAKVGQTVTSKQKNHEKKEKIHAKRVLLGKVKDTNLIYFYYFCFETY